MKRVIVISTSLRHGSNSDILADKFVEGALSAGNNVEKISLAGKEIQFCRGCFACQKLGRCVIKDDVNDIMAKVLEADVVCWATPIYYYEMSGQMKTLIDRLNALYPLDYRFRDVYLLTTAAAPVDSLVALDLGRNHRRYQACQSGFILGCFQTVLLPSYRSQQADRLPAFPGRSGFIPDRDSRRRRVRCCDLCGHSGGASAG